MILFHIRLPSDVDSLYLWHKVKMDGVNVMHLPSEVWVYGKTNIARFEFVLEHCLAMGQVVVEVKKFED